jgi:hypothetical protein
MMLIVHIHIDAHTYIQHMVLFDMFPVKFFYLLTQFGIMLGPVDIRSISDFCSQCAVNGHSVLKGKNSL